MCISTPKNSHTPFSPFQQQQQQHQVQQSPQQVQQQVQLQQQQVNSPGGATSAGKGSQSPGNTSSPGTAVSGANNKSLTEPKPVECNLCHRKFKNIPALNGHMRLHGGYYRKVPELRFKVLIIQALCRLDPPLYGTNFPGFFLVLWRIAQTRIYVGFGGIIELPLTEIIEEG